MQTVIETIQSSTFIKAMQDPTKADVVLFGVPMDYTVSFKAGSRFGPQGIRNASQGLEEYSPVACRRLSNLKFADIGDLVLPFGNVEKTIDTIFDAVTDLVQKGKVPFMLGGEHLITYPAVKAVAAKYEDLVVIQLDAHTDLRDEFFGEKLSHATVIRRIIDFLPPENVYQFGIRSGEEHEFDYAKMNTHLTQDVVLEPLLDILPDMKGRPIYLTLDIDVLDPAFAPGTGTQEPGGITTMELLKSLRALKGQQIVGMDLVEVSPPNDPSGITSILGAKIVREALLSFW